MEALNTQAVERVVQSDQDVPRVKMQEAKNAFDSGEAVFVDVRSLPSYEAAHIPARFRLRFLKLKRKPLSWIGRVVHHLLHLTGRVIERPWGVHHVPLGFKNVYALLGGCRDGSRGFPLESGAAD